MGGHVSEAHDLVLGAIDRLAPLLESTGLDEVEVETGDLLVRVARPRATAPAVATAAAPARAAAPPAASAPAGAPSPAPFGEPGPGMRFVTAPLTGVWYPAPSPGARPYVTEGDEIHAGQVVGLIEAMKLFNEIKSDAGGHVTRVLVDNGTLVKRQQPLIEIDPG
jgi:acetyl-CoA carboxylase biotin carboxyl carrier protein